MGEAFGPVTECKKATRRRIRRSSKWVQDFSGFFRDEKEINVRLEGLMMKAFDAIWQTAQERKLSIRTAAFVIACQRVLAAREQRELYP